MRFWLRSLLILFAMVVAYVPIIANDSFGIRTIAWLFAVLLGGSGASYAFLRCPNCGKWARWLPIGRGPLFFDLRCRYCGVEY